MIRVTTNSTLYTYKSNLYQSTNQLYSAMTKLMTQRNFDSYSSNPAAATRAFKIHSALNATNAQYQNNSTALNKFNTAWDVVDQVYDKLTTDMGQLPGLSGLNDPNGSTLAAQAKILRAGADTIIQNMNGKYDDEFIFNGADSQNPPFAIVSDQSQTPPVDVVTYRGLRVDVPDNGETYLDPETGWPLDEDLEPFDPNDPVNNGKTALKNEQVLEKLNELNDESHYIDVGLGFTMGDDGSVVDSTAFDSAISGIQILGYGADGDGAPQNLASIMLRLADMFESYDPETRIWGTGSYEDASALFDKFTQSQQNLSTQHATYLDTQAKFLQTNQTRLEETYDSLDSERANIEDIDQVDAIMELIWAQTCYNAALQVGTNVIPQSLMDYMR